MSSCSTDLVSSAPNYNDIHFDDIRDAEAAASKALKNIQSIYNEIMTPKGYFETEAELIYENRSDSPVSLSTNKSQYKESNKSKSSPLHTAPKLFCKNKITSQIKSQNRKTYSTSSEDSSVSEISNPCDNYLTPKESVKITIPEPFSLCKENIKRQQAKNLKIAKMKKELNEQSEKEFKVRITSKPVPKHVNLPLYEEMVARNEKRKIERKEKSKEIIKTLKPFELSYMKSSLARSHSDGNLPKNSCSNFKAKPVPKCILDENLSKKLKNKEEIRKLLNAERAKEMLKKSSSPFTPKNIRNTYSTCYANNNSKNKPKLSQPEIDAVTRRLYTLRCKEAFEDWNNKVLQNNFVPKKGIAPNETSKTVHQKGNSQVHIDSSLPFYTFPVRMSTASILRDKLIREEIDKRGKREEPDFVMKSETEKKRRELIKNIWPRLKSVEQSTNLEENITEKVKSYRESQKSRELEYLKELEEMMERVSKQNLLIERQSKGSKTSLKEDTSDSEEKHTTSSDNKSDKQDSEEEGSESSEQYTENVKSDENSEKEDSSSHSSET